MLCLSLINFLCMESTVAVTITTCFMTVLHLLYYIIKNMYFVTFFLFN